jgi:homoserine trans-succinylase
MYDKFVSHLNRTPLSELAARWVGVLELAKEHEVAKNRADWLAMFMWNSTALTVGDKELAERKEARRREAVRKAEVEQKHQEAEIYKKLSCRKLIFWKHCSEYDRRQLVKNYLPNTDDFYQQYVSENYLDHLNDISDHTALLWFWNALPPFSLESLPFKKPEAKAA